jgi:tetratricopeptide (TPR) repeat protein
MNRMKIHLNISVVVIALFVITPPTSLRGQSSRFRHKVDKSLILSDFQKQSFTSLNAKLEELQKAYEEDYQAEDYVFDAFDAFKKADTTDGPKFQNWIMQFPASYAPYVARAEFYCASAFHARGNRQIIEKDQNEYKEMERYYSLALLDIDQALKLNMGIDVCYALKEEIGMALTQHDLAINALLEASKYHPYGVRVKLKYAQTLTPRKGGSYEKMEGFIRSYEKMAVYNPKMKELSASLPAEKGSTCLYLGKYDQAVQMYTEALKLSKYHSYYADRGDAYTHLEKYKLAFADYDRALELSPHDPDYLQRKTQAVSSQNHSVKNQSAQRNSKQSDVYDDWSLKTSFTSGNVQASEHSKKGYAFLRQGQFTEAITEYTEAIRLRPDDNVLYYNRGSCYMQSNNDDAALQDFNKSLELKRDNYLAYVKITTIYANRGMFDDAISSINTAITLQPDNAEAFYYRGKVFEKKGSNIEAVEDIRHACEMGYQRACLEYKINR